MRSNSKDEVIKDIIDGLLKWQILDAKVYMKPTGCVIDDDFAVRLAKELSVAIEEQMRTGSTLPEYLEIARVIII